MKKLVMFICSVALIGIVFPAWATIPEEKSSDGTIQVRVSKELQEVGKLFADAYAAGKSGVAIETSVLNEEEAIDFALLPGQISLVTKDDLKGYDSRTTRINVIGREIYVPVMNTGNPFLDDIMKQGISPKEFAMLYSAGNSAEWNDILKNGSALAVKPYRVDNPSFTAYLTDFIETDGKSMKGNMLESCEAVLAAVQSDRNAIGFCSLSQLNLLEKSSAPMTVSMIPVDLNDNNQLDHFEEIYGSVEELTRGIWIGKYTGTLYSRIFVVSSTSAAGSVEQDFIRWMITDGQELLASSGYSPLMENERAAILANLENVVTVPAQSEEASSRSAFGFLLISVLLGGGILLFVVLLFFNRKETEFEKKGVVRKPLSESSLVAPGGYFFDRSHTWTFLEKDGKIRVGVDGFLQKIAGTITRVEMKSPGEKVKKGETVVALIQNGKKIELKSPITGVIIEQNRTLLTASTLINSSPFYDGWIYLVEPANWSEEMMSMFMGTKYSEWIKSEYLRLKDFLAKVIQPVTLKAIVLQEGGEIAEGVLKDLGPEVWEEFQTGFLKN